MMACTNCSCGLKQIEMARSINKIQVKQRDPSKVMDRSNTAVFMDGIPMKNVSELEVRIDQTGRGKVTITMYAQVEMEESMVQDAEVKT
jgi:hypothetical protein